MKLLAQFVLLSMLVINSASAVSQEVLEMEKKRQCQSIHLGYEMREAIRLSKTSAQLQISQNHPSCPIPEHVVASAQWQVGSSHPCQIHG